jgi:predicted extracellular nuclease
MATEVPLVNLIGAEKPAERFSFVFDGNSQVLDHMLVSPALLDYLVGADILHFNTLAPYAAVEDDPTTPLGSSDHDPVEGRFRFK